MPLNRFRVLQSICGVLSAPAIVGFPAIVKSQSLPLVRVGSLPSDGGASVFYTQELGLFAKAGLDVQIQPPMGSGPVLAQAVAANAIDIGVSNAATIAAARLRGLPFRFIAPANTVRPRPKQTDLVMVRKDSPLGPGPGLNGKTFGINGLRDLQEIEARGWVDRFGGDSNTIKFVEIPFTAMGAALEQRRVDVIFPAEPFSTQDQDVGKSIGVAFDGIAPSFMVIGYFTTETWLQSHGDVAAKFAAALRQGSQWANAHHGETAKMLTKYNRVSLDVANRMVRALYGLDLEPAMIVPVIDRALQYGIIDRPVPVSDLIWRAPKA